LPLVNFSDVIVYYFAVPTSKIIKKSFFFIKYKIRFSIPDRYWQYLASTISVYRKSKYIEQHKSFGSLNPSINFFVIRRRPPGWGFFSNYFYVLKGIIYAEQNNLIPVIDMENYWIGELSSLKKINDTHNAWCYFFNQTSKFSLSEIYRSKSVIISNGFEILEKNHWLNDKNFEFISQPDKLIILNKIVNEYITFNETTKKNIELVKKKINWEPQNTFGVFIRGTNYFKTQEHLTSDINDFIFACKQILKDNSLRKIYISTEDFLLYKKLVEIFSNYEVISSIRHDINQPTEDWVKDQKLTFDGGILLGYEKTLSYLTEANLMAECFSFIGTPSNASAYIMSKRKIRFGESFVFTKGEKIRVF
jgi:hypothetical protein